jgi:serine/threonine protein kinase
VNAHTIFLEALEKTNAAERAAYLDAVCGKDLAIRRRIEKLLVAHEAAGAFLEDDPALPPEMTGPEQPLAEGPGSVIGPYKLLQQIGEGGFGVVYMAEQSQPVRRLVALKIIKPGMDTAQVIARFESERQALALMDHQNIAKVHDGGTTESGHPYFVMELVKGVPITEFCDKNHLPPEPRLKLFLDVCHAIQHAHHKGVIHRDIKPSNVLVTLHDSVPVVKVIDFGVAKATVQKLTERTLFTAYGQMVGTPAYMSPEQAEMSGLDIDTRSDVYSLGVLLYELLTGTTPLEVKRLREAGYVEMQRLIREEEAPRPSTRLSSLGDSATVIADNRGMEVKRLEQLLASDLDWVVLKALNKDRNRRYATPGNFAEDIERYLRREAILARPPSMVYKLKKFAQRNRAAVVTAAAVAAALLGGTAVATWQAVRATRAEAAALAAAESAQAREAETKQVLEFVENQVFAAARPEGFEGGLGQDVSLRRAIEAALPFVAKNFTNQPLIEARLWLTLGKSFAYLGETRIAAEQCHTARQIYTTHLGPDHPETLRSMHDLANCYRDLGRYAEAFRLYEETLALRKTKLGPDHPDTLASMSSLANSYSDLGRYAEAFRLYEETLALRKAKLGPDHPDTFMSMSSLAHGYSSLGRHAEALKLNEETLALRKAKLGPDHPNTLRSMNNLAMSYFALGRYAEALKLHGETLARYKAKLGLDHPDTLNSMWGLAMSYFALGQHANSLKLYEETLAQYKVKLGPDHPSTLGIMVHLANNYAILGRHAEALKLFEEALALRKAKLGPDHPAMRRSMNALARFLATASDLKFRDPPRAVELASKAAELSPTNPDFRDTLGGARYRTGDWKGAIADLEKAISLRNPDHPSNAFGGFFLAMAHWQLGQKDEARTWFEKSVQWMNRGLQDNIELKRFCAEAADLLRVKTTN